jgi:integrase
VNAVTLAVVPALDDGYAGRLGELVDVPALITRGWDPERRRFVPAPSDPLFGYSRCPVRGCLNVTEHTATALCSRCQHRFGRWSRVHPDGALNGFLGEVTQVRSEDPERLCLVCRTPGRERPAAAHGLCYSCVRQARNRGQSVEAYIAGDERRPAARPRETFGMCRMACDALAAGRDGLCGEHLRHWQHAGRPAGPEFEAWREQRGQPLPPGRFVDLRKLPDVVQTELLIGLSVAIDGHRRTRVSDLRRVVALIGEREVASLADLDVTGVRTPGMRLFVTWAQDRLRLAFADPDLEWRKDMWDMRVFGKPQAYRVDFAAISQTWLRELAKQWSRERAPLVHASSTQRAVISIAELSRSLRRREDRGDHPGALARSDISLFLARIGRAHAAERISTHRRAVLVGDVAYFLRGARDLGLGAEGRPMFGLPAEFSLTRDDVRRTARRPAQASARALPDVLVAQLLDEPALSLLEQMHGQTTRRAIELLADTGRRPNEICILTVDCLDYDNEHDDSGAERQLGVLVHDMPKVARQGCRLPIDQATVELILAQKRTVRARYPDTPAAQLRLFPRMLRNPQGTIPMTPAHISRIMRRWVTAIPALVDVDGSAFPREGIVAYAFRHSYAQRHADNGTPVEVLRELMGHASMVTTQGYYRVRHERARRAVQTLAPLQIDRHGHRTMPVVQELLESERLRREVGQIAVPLGLCTEPSNVKARGQGCVYRYRCVGCEHFRTDPSNQAELREYLHQLLTGRERLATTVPQLADWAQRDAMPNEEEISALRALIRRNEQIVDELEPNDRAAVLEAIATTRRLRAQLQVTIPDRYKGITRPPRPTLHPRPVAPIT